MPPTHAGSGWDSPHGAEGSTTVKASPPKPRPDLALALCAGSELAECPGDRKSRRPDGGEEPADQADDRGIDDPLDQE